MGTNPDWFHVSVVRTNICRPHQSPVPIRFFRGPTVIIVSIYVRATLKKIGVNGAGGSKIQMFVRTSAASELLIPHSRVTVTSWTAFGSFTALWQYVIDWIFGNKTMWDSNERVPRYLSCQVSKELSEFIAKKFGLHAKTVLWRQKTTYPRMG